MAEPLFALFALIPIALTSFYAYARLRIYGDLPITTTEIAYDRAAYGHLLDWDKHALIIEGRPTPIFSGEFHYWRLPDRDRWEPTLRRYQSAGLNTIRIYFHWGYHSPNEGEYKFDGNRDIDYLLDLCERLNIFVLAAPGPYICAETQAGGFPTWLIAKRQLRIRHNKVMLWKVYDLVYAEHEKDWYREILAIIARHQITAAPSSADTTPRNKGCVIGVQIENEQFETMKHLLPIGLHDQMRVLGKAARDFGITVPLFTNDGFEEGSWVARPELDSIKQSFWHRRKFGLDLYGYDKYIVFAPNSSPKSRVVNNEVHLEAWPEWTPQTVEKAVDKLEKTVRGFGSGAAQSPHFIPELQGGWFNHYQLRQTYDDIFNYYGEHYTRTIVESVLAQGVTMTSIYMFYGGTNWGTLGDPDVYTSYDYSACIREYGYLSSRARHLRLTFLFARSFTAHFARTDRARTPSVSVSIPHILNVQRISASATTTPARDPPVEFTFLRNFDRKRRDRFEVTLATRNVTLECALAYKKSFIALGKYTAAYSRVRLELSTVPIHLRLKSPAAQATEVWVVDANSAGQMAFDGTVVVTGSLEAIVKPAAGGSVSVVSFGKKRGWAKIERTGAGYEAENGKLYVLALNEKELSTLGAEFVEPYWDARGDGEGRDGAVTAMWGVYDAWVERGNGVIVVEREEGDRSVTVVSFEKPRDDGFRGGDGEWDGLPFVYTKTFEDLDTTSSPSPTTLLANIELRDWQTRPVDLSAAKWLPLQFPSASSPHPSLNAIDYHFTSGHILYRCTFPSPAYGRKVRLSLNVRNRATVYLNDRFVGGHTTYSLQLFLPGAKVGPDPAFLGSKNYDLTSHLLQSEHNTLLVLVDSFGLSRQAFVMNDVRNSRGIIRAAVKGIGSQNLTWSVTGVDVRHLQNPFNSTGIPDDPTVGTYFSAPAFDRFIPDAGPTWYQCMFDHPLAGGQVHAPLRLVIEGRFTTYVVLNDVVVARYYGDSEGEGDADGPQHDFYLMDGLVRPQGNVIRLLVYGWREISNIRVQIKGWVIERGSGNLAKSVAGVEEGMPFSFVRETVRI